MSRRSGTAGPETPPPAPTPTTRHDADACRCAIVTHMSQLAWFARAAGFIEDSNPCWYEDTGTTAPDRAGWGWQSVHDPVELPRVMERWQHAIATGDLLDMEFPLRRHDGVFRIFLTRVRPIRDGLDHRPQASRAGAGSPVRE